MGLKLKHIKTLAAIIFTLLTILVPVAKNYHVVSHVHTEVSGSTISERCSICDFNFSTFDDAETIILSAVEVPITSLYIPSIIGNYFPNQQKTNVIRGPPNA